jgi:GT2 family glycosyltransferase
MTHRTTFVVNSVDDAKFLLFQQNLHKVSCGRGYPIVRIEDARSMAEGLNRGGRIAASEYIIFCHDDIEFVSSDPVIAVERALQDYDVVGLCGTERLVSGNWYDAGQPYLQGSVLAPSLSGKGYDLQIFGVSPSAVLDGTKAIDGIFIACRKAMFEHIKGFDEKTFTGWHGYDVDFTFRAHLAGAKMATLVDVLVYHKSHMANLTADKLREFAHFQSIIVARHRREMSDVRGDRRHKSISVPSFDAAVRMLNRERFRDGGLEA